MNAARLVHTRTMRHLVLKTVTTTTHCDDSHASESRQVLHSHIALAPNTPQKK